MWLKVVRLLTLLVLLNMTILLAQSPEPAPSEQGPPPPPPPAKPEFFAGIVTALASDRITVSRTLFGKAPENRTFLIQARTKMNKTLKVKTRVTVRHQQMAEGDVALEIQIRAQTRPAKPS